MPKLLIQENGQQSLFELFDDEATIGRGAASSVQVADARASKHHAVVRRVHGRPKLVDLESKNGTRVNGEFHNQRWLEHGDVIAIGEMTMTYDAGDAPSGPPESARSVAVAVAAAAPAAAPAPARTAPVVVSSRRREGAPRRHDDEDGDERPRGYVRRKDSKSPAIAVAVGGGLILAVFLLIKLLGTGGSPNQSAIAHAKKLANAGDSASAIAWLEQHSDSSRPDYQTVVDEIQQLRATLDDQDRQRKEDEGAAIFKKIEWDVAEQHKNGQTDEQLGRRLLEFAANYPDTLKAKALAHDQNKPYPKYRELMQTAAKK